MYFSEIILLITADSLFFLETYSLSSLHLKFDGVLKSKKYSVYKCSDQPVFTTLTHTSVKIGLFYVYHITALNHACVCL